MARARILGNRVHVKTKWNPGSAEKAKRVPGASWEPDTLEWSYPLTMESCRALREVYGENLHSSPELLRWARRQLRQTRKMTALGTATDAQLKLLPELFPNLATALDARPYQKPGARFIAEGKRVGIFDEVGLGKTITTIAGVIEAGHFEGNHLVISTLTAMDAVWREEITRWTEGAAAVFVAAGTAAQRTAIIAEFAASPAPSKWLVVNPAMLAIKKAPWCTKCKAWDDEIGQERTEHWTEAHKPVNKVRVHKYPQLQKLVWDSIIADEAHKYLTTGIKSKLKKTQVAEGITALPEGRDQLRVALTGTPARGQELNLWGIMHWLWPKVYSGKWDWVNTYFEKDENFFGVTIGGIRPDREPDFWTMLDKHTLRRTRAEVRADLPVSAPPVIEWVEMDRVHSVQYREFEELGVIDLQGREMAAMSYLAELTRQKQMAWGLMEWRGGKLMPTTHSPKLVRLRNILRREGVLDGTRKGTHYKFAIASQFATVLDVIEAELNDEGVETLKITGKTSAKRRAAAARSFQNDPDGPRVILLNTYAAGESLTLDRFCDTMFILDETWIADDQLQLHGRIDNRSVTAATAVPRHFVYLLTRGTIEERVKRHSLDQIQLQHRLLDARRGVQLALTLMGEK